MVLAYANHAEAYNGIWKQQEGRVATKGVNELKPERYLIYKADNEYLRQVLFSLSPIPEDGVMIELPAPDGSFKTYKIWQRSNLAPELAGRYPDIRSFTGYDISDKSVIAVFDYSPRGFDAMIFNGDKTYFIDPYSNINDGYYLCYYKRDYMRPAGKNPSCSVVDKEEDDLKTGRLSLTKSGLPELEKLTGGTSTHSYKLALACTGEYATAVGGATPTKTSVLAAMNTSLTRVNGVYRSELGIEMILIANNDALIFLDPLTDPYTSQNPKTMRDENQTYMSANLNSGDYDIGHVFDAGAGSGIAELGAVCNNSVKARGVTGQTNPVGDAFDIDFVVHEMGHQFNARHTFNSSSGQCTAPNGAVNSAYEPGSGSTIMAYAGICGINDLQLHSDDYFHAISQTQISGYVTSGTGATCGTANASTNTPASVLSVSNTLFIPYLTPFELTAPTATDADHDALTYCWEEWDLADFGADFAATKDGPIFRSFKGTGTETRVFPKMDMIRANVTSYLGEKLPSDERTMKFKLTVRDILNGWGIFQTSNDNEELVLQVVNTGAPFKVNVPDSHTAYWRVGSTVDVKWDVVNTNNPPINATGVDIFLSLDDGQTYPYLLAQNVPNMGSASVTVPNDAYTASARVKVKGAGNVFFDISNESFIINEWPESVKGVSWAADVNVFPVPAHQELNIQVNQNRDYNIVVTNTVGQQVWAGNMRNKTTINIGSWPTGIYQLQITDAGSGERLVKKVLVQ